MYVHLCKHPFIIANVPDIDWRFWEIHAGHADLEHNQLVRAAVAELLLDSKHPHAVSEIAAGYQASHVIDVHGAPVHPGLLACRVRPRCPRSIEPHLILK
jgi:hypothetical protein